MATPQKIVYLIRHATPDWDDRSVPYDVPPGPTLTAQGRQEAHLMAAYLAGAGILRVLTSVMDRAHETATILGKTLGLPVEIEPGLIEVANTESATARVTRVVDMWQRQVIETPTNAPIALVTHGGPIAILLTEVATPRVQLGLYTSRFDRQNPAPPSGVWQFGQRADGTWQADLIYAPLKTDQVKV